VGNEQHCNSVSRRGKAQCSIEELPIYPSEILDHRVAADLLPTGGPATLAVRTRRMSTRSKRTLPSSPIAVVGLAGAGKSTISRLLANDYGCSILYFGRVVIDELRSREMELSPENERAVRETLRDQEGMAVMAKRNLPELRARLQAGEHVVIDGLYSYDELKLLNSSIEGGIRLLAIHAPRRLRVERLAARSIRPLRCAEVVARDFREVEQLDKAAPIALADAHILNVGDQSALADSLEDALGWLADDTAIGAPI
jgi:dephospho-CoA kinase